MSSSSLLLYERAAFVLLLVKMFSDFIPKAHNYTLEQVEPEVEEAWPSSNFFIILSLLSTLF